MSAHLLPFLICNQKHLLCHILCCRQIFLTIWRTYQVYKPITVCIQFFKVIKRIFSPLIMVPLCLRNSRSSVQAWNTSKYLLQGLLLFSGTTIKNFIINLVCQDFSGQKIGRFKVHLFINGQNPRNCQFAVSTLNLPIIGGWYSKSSAACSCVRPIILRCFRSRSPILT